MSLAYKAGLAAFACMALIALTSSTASADSIVVAKNTTTNTPAMYMKRGPVCSKRVLSVNQSKEYVVQGTSNADIIFVFDSGEPFNWCGYTGIQPIKAMLGGDLVVRGNGGGDVIWGGHGGGAARVSRIYGSDSTDAYGKGDTVYGGPALRVEGSHYDDVLLFPAANGGEGFGGDDLLCTKVSDVFGNAAMTYLNGGLGKDIRVGPPALSEIEVDFAGGPSDQDRCNLAYIAAYYAVLGMLAQ